LIPHSGSDSSVFYIDYALEKLNEIRESLILVEAVDTELKIKLEDIIEHFEDQMGEHVSTARELNSSLTEMARQAIKAMQIAQTRMA